MIEIDRPAREGRFGPAGLWWVAMPIDQWPTDKDSRDLLPANWHDPFGDRRHGIVYIAALTNGLDGRLWTDAEPHSHGDPWLSTDETVLS